jgi:hypothetical protein
MKRLAAAISFAVIAFPAAAIEHGGPWEVNETRAPWDQKERDRKAPEATEKTSPAPEAQQR